MNHVLDIGGGKQETVQNKFPLNPYSLHLSYWKKKKYVYFRKYRVFFLTAPSPVQYRKENRPMSQPEAFLDEEIHGTAAPIG